MKKILSELRLQKKKILFSSVTAFVISLLCYLLGNCPYPYWDSLNKFCWIEYFISNLFNEEVDKSDALFINVGYDKQVADFTYSNGNLQGTIAITDREKLLQFLEVAERTDTYKYIFLDIRFEEGVNTVNDSALFNKIDNMRDIAFSSHSDLKTNTKAPDSKAAVNDYFTTVVSTNFTRYQYLQNNVESAPLRIFTSVDTIHNKSIHKWGLFYYSNGKLCQNSPFMRMPQDFWLGHGVNGHQNYYDLGPQLLNFYNEEDWRTRIFPWQHHADHA